jgi:hypothetical protein
LGYWLEKAAECLPGLEDLLTREDAIPGPMALWIELHLELVKAYDASPPNDDLIRGIYDYAAWCLAEPQTGDANTDLPTAVAVAFIEHLPLDRPVAQDLHCWISLESFKGFENLFRYHFSDEQYRQFAKDFRSKKKPSDLSPRL